MEFPFKRGGVTLAKLMRPTKGELQLFAARGEVVESEGVRGSVAAVRPEPSARAFLDRVMRLAVEHHFALVYGDWMAELQMLCEFTGLNLA